MRAALCLFGKVGSTLGKKAGDVVDYKLCYEHYKKHIIDINNCDVFIHTWGVNYEEELTKLYKPKKSIFEVQKDFTKKKYKIGKKDAATLRNYSRWFSTKQVILLKKQYEEEHNFKYDWVMFGRFDLLFFTDVKFKKLDSKYFYAAKWNSPPLWRKNRLEPDKFNRSLFKPGLSDLWFLGNSKTMDKFGLLYDKLWKYKKSSAHKCAYQHVKRVVGPPKKVIKYILWRWWDFELYRWKICKTFK